MQSIRKFYNKGMGPSSSHTMGPRKAAGIFNDKHPEAHSFRVILYGSMALTGKGHLTDVAIYNAMKKPVEIMWEYQVFLPKHPNGMTFESLAADGGVTDSWTVYSVGGGEIRTDQDFYNPPKHIYPHKTMDEILAYAQKKNITLWQYVEETEGQKIWTFLSGIWATMNNTINRGMKKGGLLPGHLGLERKSAGFAATSKKDSRYTQTMNALFAYALATSEENASGGIVVTAPTCGSCGVLPGVLRMMQETFWFSEMEILRALATAALFGNLAKANASISGAEVGCQGEIGVACAMAAAAATQLSGGTNKQIEYAAEMGLEHNLGLTCDPVAGLVQIPCIERNAMAAARAADCASYAMQQQESKVSYDDILKTMMLTGQAMSSDYRETAKGGLAKVLKNYGK